MFRRPFIICLFLILSLTVLTLCVPIANRQLLRKFPHGRIVGGHDANIEDFPYQISLLWNTLHICGGSIIDATHILTAAHCTDGSSASVFSIRAGSSLFEQGGTVVNVKAIYQNPLFNASTYDYDVAVLELSEALTFDTGIGAVGLANSELEAGIEVNVTGWGATEESSLLESVQLQVVNLPIVSRENCSSDYEGYQITDRMICAGVPEGGKDTCDGDSGGPLVKDGIQYGIDSWGYGCAEAGYPGIFSNVATLRDFIDSVLN